MLRKDRLIAELRTLFEQISGEELAETVPTTPFIELGFDSLLLTQAGQAIAAEFGVSLKLRQLLEDLNNIEALATYLDGVLASDAFGGEASMVPRTEPVRSVEPVTATVAMAAAPSTARVPFPAPVASGSVLEQVVHQQLALMARQLELLAGGGVTTPAPDPAVATAKPFDVPVAQDVATVVAAPLERAVNATPAPNDAGDVPLESPTRKKGFGPQLVIERASTDTFSADQQRHLERLVTRYTEKTRSSKGYTQQNRARLADPRTASGFRPKIKELVYPLVVDRSSGSRLWDIDGNEYVDFLNGFGSNFFGHSPPFVKKALAEQLERGIEIGPQHPLTAEVGALVSELTGMERVAFCNTGSEAVLGALRVARTVTGRNTVVMFNGGYHGILDEVIVRGTKKLKSLPAAPGVPPSAVENMLVLELGSPEALEVIRSRAGQIAAVITEPVQSRRPELVPIDFLKEVRRITEASGAALIFDEVVTGFRCAPGGAQERFGIRADIATYGKVVGGGLSIGIIAGAPRWMDALDGGTWQYGDDSIPEVGVTYFAGTFVRHPLALAAAKAALTHIKESGPGLQKHVDELASRFEESLNSWLTSRRAPLTVHRFSSLLKVAFTEDVPYGELLAVHLRENGVHAWDGRPGFLTEAHTQEDVNFLIKAFQRSVLALEEGGFLPKRSAVQHHSRPPTPGARLGRDPRGNPAWFVPDPDRPGKFQQVVSA